MSLLRAARLRRAPKLLVTTDTPVARIAHDGGFVGRSSFSRAFRKMHSVDRPNLGGSRSVRNLNEYLLRSGHSYLATISAFAPL
jgi:hypothetical protein